MDQAASQRGGFEPIPAETEELAARLIEAAFRVHRGTGPGLLESVYQACMCYELDQEKLPYEHEVDLPVEYHGVRLRAGLRLDIWAGRQVILELKAVDKVLPIHKAQLLTYMKLTGCRIGFIINFNVPRLKDGIVRMVR